MRSIVWFRHNLRLSDNAPLRLAAEQGAVLPVYVHDPALSLFSDTARRVWRSKSLESLDSSLRSRKNRLFVFQGSTQEILRRMAAHIRAQKIYAYRGLTSEDRALEDILSGSLAEMGVQLCLTGFDTLFPPDRASEGRSSPWKIFTPYYRFCRSAFLPEAPLPPPVRVDPCPDFGGLPGETDFRQGETPFLTGLAPGEVGAMNRLQEFVETALHGYATWRDFPGEDFTSRLSPHLAAGEISVREIFWTVQESKAPEEDRQKFLEELGWREFSSHLLFHHPEMLVEPLRKEFDSFEWVVDEERFAVWSQGRTGIPLVDAGMRELAQTGWMHNRVRMVVGSFLVKNLGISWQDGEKWFADHLIDYDPANNAASWQWVAGCGTDSAPYFRIMNPVLQSQRYDPMARYIRRFLPELSALPDVQVHTLGRCSISKGSALPYRAMDYPEPCVDLTASREAALKRYRRIRSIPLMP